MIFVTTVFRACSHSGPSTTGTAAMASPMTVSGPTVVDLAALDAAIDDDTVAVLLEPVQGEAGVLIPPGGFPDGRA
ncbi:hypothetical protein [Streptomyces sp. NPDC056190]|uniref:hypothetical protein n=1 Tax=Streptomyces sp. NPDC056190 TaxID=3345741 RepID=UPI0035DFB27C